MNLGVTFFTTTFALAALLQSHRNIKRFYLWVGSKHRQYKHGYRKENILRERTTAPAALPKVTFGPPKPNDRSYIPGLSSKIMTSTIDAIEEASSVAEVQVSINLWFSAFSVEFQIKPKRRLLPGRRQKETEHAKSLGKAIVRASFYNRQEVAHLDEIVLNFRENIFKLLKPIAGVQVKPEREGNHYRLIVFASASLLKSTLKHPELINKLVQKLFAHELGHGIHWKLEEQGNMFDILTPTKDFFGASGPIPTLDLVGESSSSICPSDSRSFAKVTPKTRPYSLTSPEEYFCELHAESLTVTRNHPYWGSIAHFNLVRQLYVMEWNFPGTVGGIIERYIDNHVSAFDAYTADEIRATYLGRSTEDSVETLRQLCEEIAASQDFELVENLLEHRLTYLPLPSSERPFPRIPSSISRRFAS